MKFLGLGALAGLTTGAYAMFVEPFLRLQIKEQKLALPHWPEGLKLKVAILADIHACEPWMSAKRIAELVAHTNVLKPDIILLMGDYMTSMRLVTKQLPPEIWSKELAKLDAPLGVHAVLGNHDWWEDDEAQLAGQGPIASQRALEAVGIQAYENKAIRIQKDGHGFWLAGLGDQIALLPREALERYGMNGIDDLAGTLDQVSTKEPILLMAHEPDIFPQVPDRVSLTLSGHTHGGQVTFFGQAIFVPSAYGTRYAYGHIIEKGRNLFVSGGLGFSILPFRLGRPPEINVLEISA